MSPRWRVWRLGSESSAFGPFWIAQQGKTLLSEAFETFPEAIEFAQAAARENWGYRA